MRILLARIAAAPERPSVWHTRSAARRSLVQDTASMFNSTLATTVQAASSAASTSRRQRSEWIGRHRFGRRQVLLIVLQLRLVQAGQNSTCAGSGGRHRHSRSPYLARSASSRPAFQHHAAGPAPARPPRRPDHSTRQAPAVACWSELAAPCRPRDSAHRTWPATGREPFAAKTRTARGENGLHLHSSARCVRR